MEQAMLRVRVVGKSGRRAHRRSAHPFCNPHRIVGRGFGRDINYRREAHSFEQVHPQHVVSPRSLGFPRRLHFPGSPKSLGEGGYSSPLPGRNRCISLKMNNGDTFYSSLGWGVFTTHMAGPRADHESAAITGRSREVPSRPQKGCQAVPGVSRCNLFKTQDRGAKQASRIRVCILEASRPLTARFKPQFQVIIDQGNFVVCRNTGSQN